LQNRFARKLDIAAPTTSLLEVIGGKRNWHEPAVSGRHVIRRKPQMGAYCWISARSPTFSPDEFPVHWLERLGNGLSPSR
jgi:hypothetical protein